MSLARWMAPAGAGRPINYFRLKNFLAICVTAGAALSLAACSGSDNSDLFAGKGSPTYKGSGPIPKGGGRYHVGKPYKINGKKYYPKDVASYERTGTASWYGPKFHKRMTSNGEFFDMYDLTAAHTTLPLPSYVKVTNLSNGKQAVVRVNDRGPFAHNREIDLSKRTSEVLGFKGRGTVPVRVVYLGKAPLRHDGRHLAEMNKRHLKSQDWMRVASAMKYSASSTRLASNTQPAQTPEPATENRSGRIFVQAAAFSNPANAERARANLSGIGDVAITPLAAQSGMIYRVRVGPLDSERQAYEAVQQVAALGMHGATIVTD